MTGFQNEKERIFFAVYLKVTKNLLRDIKNLFIWLDQIKLRKREGLL